MADRRTPFVASDEKTTLVAFLDYLRESMILKTQGLSDDRARTSVVPSGTSLLGLVKHLSFVERWWFQVCFVGAEPDEVRDDWDVANDTVGEVVDRYRQSIAASNAVVEACDDLDRLCKAHRTDLSLRWVLVHMVEETARHAGHADILREQLDGSVGR